MEGWIKIYRKLSDNPLWTSEPFTRGQAWVDLIMLANHEDGFFYLRDHKINVSRGQVGWSHLKLSERWKWSRSKVKKFINDLEKEQQVIQQQSHSTSVITLLNYDKFQEKEQQVIQQKDNRKTTERQQDNTNKNEKNEKNTLYTDFISSFNSITSKKCKGGSKDSKQFDARIKEGYTISDFETAIKNCKSDKYHIENPHFLTPEFITRADKLERYLNYKQQTQQPVGRVLQTYTKDTPIR